MGNPYRTMYHWINIEVQELHALRESIHSLKGIERKINSIKKDMNEKKTELNDMAAGKTTFKSVIRTITFSKITQDQLVRQIETCEKEIENWQKLRDYVLQYVPQVVFPKFKRERGRIYFKFLINFAENQSMTSEKNVELWTRILENCSKQRIDSGQNPDESLLVVAKNEVEENNQTAIKMEKQAVFREGV